MAGKDFRIYLSPDALVALAPREGANRSAAISSMMSRYAEVCKRSLPDLTEDE
jgi:hypothetical protein